MLRFFVFLSLFLFSNAQCPNGTVAGPSKNFCYQAIKGNETWWSAEFSCNEKGGNLAAIDNAFTGNFLVQLAEKTFNSPGSFWVGGKVLSGSIIWSDGSKSNYTNWGKSKTFRD